MEKAYLSDLKTNKITVKISDKELKLLKQVVKESNTTVSKYVRELIRTGGRVDLSYTSDRATMIRQITGIAINVNQIAKRVNTTQHIYNYQIRELEESLREIQRVFQEVLTIWRLQKF